MTERNRAQQTLMDALSDINRGITDVCSELAELADSQSDAFMEIDTIQDFLSLALESVQAANHHLGRMSL